MRYLSIETPPFDNQGAHADVEVTWRGKYHGGEFKVVTIERFEDRPTLVYPAIAISDLTEAAIRGWQHGMGDTEPDQEKNDQYANHESRQYKPSEEVRAVYERQYNRAIQYAKQQRAQEQGDTE